MIYRAVTYTSNRTRSLMRGIQLAEGQNRIDTVQLAKIGGDMPLPYGDGYTHRV